MTQFRATTICLVRRSADDIAIAGDGQVTMGETAIMKNNAKKIRKIYRDQVLCGFAGSVSDAYSLTDTTLLATMFSPATFLNRKVL